MKFLFTNKDIKSKNSKELPFEGESKKIAGFNFLIKEDEGCETEKLFSVTSGYVRNLDLNINDPENETEKAAQNNFQNWPLPSSITGSFSSLVVEKRTGEFILCNDLIGIYPIFYLQNGNEFFVSDSMILLGIYSHNENDEVGVTQRCFGPEFSCIGSRTSIKACKRLLPGEWIKFDKQGSIIEVRYDNSLYQDISSSKQTHNYHKEYWKAYQKDISYSLNNSDKVNIALSGGIDSRVVLGAIPENKKITCLTFGAKDNYETKIASRLAKIKKAHFFSFFDPNIYFPELEVLKRYTLQTEAVYLNSWLEILENIKVKKREPLLVGDLTTALTGRTIKNFSFKKTGLKAFYRNYILKKDVELTTLNAKTFEKWKASVRKNYEGWYSEKRLSRLDFKINRGDFLESVFADLQELFNRIEAHKLPYIELADELFTWYTHSRKPMAKQILICNKDYHCYCPSMSIQNIRMASNIHPNLRFGLRFIKKLFGHSPELSKLNNIPTSQAPLIPQGSPDIVKFSIWALRAKADHYFIKRLLKSKDMNKRYRLFKSNNWALIYQNPEMKKNMEEYFSNNYLGKDYFKYLLKESIHRKNLEHWPFANMEIINAAALNIELDIIQTWKIKAATKCS